MNIIHIPGAAKLLEMTEDELRSKLAAKADPTLTATPSPRYLGIAAAEVYSGLGRWSLHRLAKSGRLPVVKLTPGTRSGKVLIDIKDLDKLLAGLKTKPARKAALLVAGGAE